MKTLVDHLSQYGEYHRDSRNIITHLVGVPVIVFAVAVLLSRPMFELMGVMVSPAAFVLLVFVLFCMRLHFGFGLLMTALLAACVWGAHQVALMSTSVWLMTGVGLFVGGWIVQFIGHYYEGKKPAFVDDLVGLAIGPLFVVAEVLFAVGIWHSLKQDIEARVGPVRNGAQAQAQ